MLRREINVTQTNMQRHMERIDALTEDIRTTHHHAINVLASLGPIDEHLESFSDLYPQLSTTLTSPIVHPLETNFSTPEEAILYLSQLLSILITDITDIIDDLAVSLIDLVDLRPRTDLAAPCDVTVVAEVASCAREELRLCASEAVRIDELADVWGRRAKRSTGSRL